MKRHLWFTGTVGISVSAAIAACATEGTKDTPRPSDSQIIVEAGLEAEAGSDADADAAPCADCEWFPDVCTDDVLCSNGPFAATTTGGAFDVRTQVNVIRGRSASDVWVAGALGAVAHFDGASWTRSDVGAQESLKALWLRDDGEVSFLRYDSLFTHGGLATPDADASAGGWTHVTVTALPADYDSANTLFESAWAFAGAEWLWGAARRNYFSPFPYPTGLRRLHRTSEGSFEVADGLGSDVFTAEMTNIHGISADSLWAVGLEGTTVQVTGAQSDAPTFELFDSQTWNALRGVWAASETEAWSVGAQGTIRHWTGDAAKWDVVADVPTTEDLTAIWGSSPTDVWAVGDAGVVLHFDGTEWSRMKIAGLGARRPDLTTVWLAGAGHVWIGGHGVVLSLGGKP